MKQHMSEIEFLIDRMEIESDLKGVRWFIKKHHLLSKSRHKEIKTLRQYIMYLTKKNNKNETWQRIGKLFNKDHSTVMHACTVIEGFLETKDKYLQNLIEKYKSEIDITNFNIY